MFEFRNQLYQSWGCHERACCHHNLCTASHLLLCFMVLEGTKEKKPAGLISDKSQWVVLIFGINRWGIKSNRWLVLSAAVLSTQMKTRDVFYFSTENSGHCWLLYTQTYTVELIFAPHTVATALSTKLKPLSHAAIDVAAILYYSLHFQRGDGGPLTASIMILSKHAHMYLCLHTAQLGWHFQYFLEAAFWELAVTYEWQMIMN